MTQSKSSLLNGATLLLALALTGCANMSERDRNTALGAGAGAVAGSVLTGGSAAGTLGGAAVGGLIVNEAQKRK
jgi:osmotically inducible lipoprotein OsmB